MLPRTGAAVISAMSSAPFTLVSRSSRATARPTPSRSPSTPASARLRSGCGETGCVATWASSMRVALIERRSTRRGGLELLDQLAAAARRRPGRCRGPAPGRRRWPRSRACTVSGTAAAVTCSRQVIGSVSPPARRPPARRAGCWSPGRRRTPRAGWRTGCRCRRRSRRSGWSRRRSGWWRRRCGVTDHVHDRGDRQDDQDAPRTRPPPPSDGASSSPAAPRVSSSCQRNFDKSKRSIALVLHPRGRVDGSAAGGRPQAAETAPRSRDARARAARTAVTTS